MEGGREGEMEGGKNDRRTDSPLIVQRRKAYVSEDAQMCSPHKQVEV